MFSLSLPCLQLLQQLQVLRLRASDVDDYGQDVHVALQARDLLAIGRALKAWPLSLLHVVEVYHHSDWLNCNDEPRFILSEEEHADAEENLRLLTCWRALGLPAAAADWTNSMTLDYLRVQQQRWRRLPEEQDARAAWCGVWRVVAGRAGTGYDCG